MAEDLLYSYQEDALKKMKNGCILCGGVGSGKSRTSLAYYFTTQGGKLKPLTMMKDPCDLYIITTARKRDTLEWIGDMHPFLITPYEDLSLYPGHKVVIDSWNNIGKYTDVEDAFFIFDEQRVVGYGSWVKSFLEITKSNKWILLSATPGDTWSDYIPVFIANGFYKNKTQFCNRHAVYSRFSKYPKIEKYIDQGHLMKLKKEILVDMDYDKPNVQDHWDIDCDYDKILYKDVMKNRWNPETHEPIENASELCYTLRRICNTSEARIEKCREIMKNHSKIIIFYNFDYELEILRQLCEEEERTYGEWNGHKHDSIPDTEEWTYLVQYTAGAEGWNCIETDTIIFFSQNYSYKVMVQAAGRIDRLNTNYHVLKYYHLKSSSPIDNAIKVALKKKKNFNERSFVG